MKIDLTGFPLSEGFGKPSPQTIPSPALRERARVRGFLPHLLSASGPVRTLALTPTLSGRAGEGAESRRGTTRGLKSAAAFVIPATALLVLAGCQVEGAEPAPPPARPVLSVVAESVARPSDNFAGTIEPAFQTDVSFRVLGRLLSRDVDVGDHVTAGETIAHLDDVALKLALRLAEADLVKARSQSTTAAASEGRMAQLLAHKTSSQADYDTAKLSKDSAAASAVQAEAAVAKAREQLGYATLTADFDGVVVSIGGQPGQIVTAGQTVVTLAKPDGLEAVIDVPLDAKDLLVPGARFRVQLQSGQGKTAFGAVREVAPEADSASRTRRLKIALDSPDPAFRIGTTVTASALSAAHHIAIVLPATALLARDGKQLVWVVDPAAKTVKTVPVEVGEHDGERVVVTDGIDPGTRVVVAGVNSLTEGQPVSVDDGATK